MIRVVIYLVIVGLFALGAAWLADRPGDVVITWQNQRIETSVMVLIIAVMAFATLAVMLWSVARAILRSPDILWMYLRTRRGVRGYLAVSQGLIAIGSGDARAARKFADEATRIAPEEPLTLLLTAQAAQLAGDRGAAERAFHAMARAPGHAAARPARTVHRSAAPRRSGGRRATMPKKRPRANRRRPGPATLCSPFAQRPETGPARSSGSIAT